MKKILDVIHIIARKLTSKQAQHNVISKQAI